jgi:hypothetical protein
MSFSKQELNKLSIGLAILVYIAVILLGLYMVTADPSTIAPIVIKISGAVVIAFGLIETIVTYINRKDTK